MRGSRLILISLVLLLIGGAVATANPFAELPNGHWSYEAIEYLAARGFVFGQRAWNFARGRTVTRYEMAMLVAQALTQLAEDVEGGTTSPGVSDRVRHLSLEFANELEVLGYTVTSQEEDVVESNHHFSQSLELDSNLDPGIHRFVLTTPAGEGVRVHTGWINSVPSWNGGLHLKDLVIDVQNTLVARVGKQEASLSDLTLQGAELDGIKAVLDLGQLGSTVILGKHLDDDEDYVGAVDGRIKLNDYFMVGATYVRRTKDIEGMFEPNGTDLQAVSSLGGTVVLTPALSFSGEYAQNLGGESDAGAVQFGANMKLGEMELGARFKNLQPGFEQRLPTYAENTGYGFSLRMGDVLVSTGRDLVLNDAEVLRTVTSYGVNYEMGNIGVLRAGYEHVDLDNLSSTLGKEIPKTTTSVGLDFHVPGGTIKADVVYAGDGIIKAPWSNNVSDDSPGPRTTSFGLGYSLNNDVAVLVGYKLVDFGDVEDEQTEKKATAEFAIRF
jgi:hypothetical protein